MSRLRRQTPQGEIYGDELKQTDGGPVTAIKDKGGIRHQFHQMIDIVPTILEATGIPAPDVQWDENFDIEADSGTAIAPMDCTVPFRFAGKLDKLTLTIDRPKLSPRDIERPKEGQTTATSGRQ